MPVTVLCPSCQTASRYAVAPLAPCPRCGVALPAEVARAAEAALRSDRSPGFKAPILVQVTTVLSGASLCMALLMFALFLLPMGSYTLNDQPVTRDVFLAAATPILFGFVVLSGAVFWPFWRQLEWGRYVAVLAVLAIDGLLVGVEARGDEVAELWR